MMATFSYFVSAFLAAAVCATVSAQGSAEWEAFKAVSESNLDFSKSMYKLQSRKGGNLFFSPASIHTILALTSLGARGTTAQQMASGLYLPTDQQKMKDGFRHFMASIYDSNTSVTKKIVNRIFTDARFPPTQEFTEIASADFHSASELVDFEHKHEEARVKINKWVEQNTENKIVDLLPEGSVDSTTSMVLVNALYFKGAWDSPFMKEETMLKPFYISDEVTKDIPMMYKFVRGEFPYYNSQALNADIIEIPYADKRVSMVVILPKEKNGLKDVETRLAGLPLRNLTSAQPSYPNVHLSLPKFKLEMSSDLNEDLTQMGMGHMFSDQADFSGLAEGPIRISKVIHKAFIDVDEKGTEAAAATGAVVSAQSLVIRAPAPEITFKADHPFVFMVVNTEVGAERRSKERTVLFMGRYARPN